MSVIDACRQFRATTGQIFSLVDLALQNPDEKHCKNILSKFKDSCFWTSTENLLGKEDIIIYDNVNGNMPPDRDSLVKRHKNGDRAVRIVPYGFQTERQSVEEFLKNPYLIAQIGNKNMLDVVERVVKGVSKNKPYVRALNPTQEDIKKYTAMNSSWLDNGLTLVGNCEGYDDFGFAFMFRNANAL